MCSIKNVGIKGLGARYSITQDLALQFFPHLALFAPVGDGGDGTEHAFADGSAAAVGGWQKKNLFLNVRCEVEQVHYLRDAGAAYVCQAGEIGVIDDFILVDQFLHMDGQRHEAGNAGDAAE